LIGLFLARWWGLILQRQISAAAIEKMNSSNGEQTQSEEANQSETPKAEGTA